MTDLIIVLLHKCSGREKKITEIYNFDTNERIRIKGYQCTVEDIPSKSDDSFFRFTVNATTQGKIIGSPEVALYFEKSEFEGEDLFNEQIPVFVYKTNMDVPLYRKTNCLVKHYFSKPIFETPDCESHSCKPTLLLLNVHCGDTTDNYYNFHNFKEYIENEEIFEAPPGVFCARKKNLAFPTLPDYFSFSYDAVKKQLTTDSIGSTETLHKKLWYYGDRGLIRRDNYDESGLLQAATVFDFNNGVTYSTMASLKECNLGQMTEDISLEKITELPSIIFPKGFGKEDNKSVYAGQRKVHDLVYDVWSLTAEAKQFEFQTVKDIYFFKNAIDSMKIIEDYEMQLVFIELFDYSPSDELGSDKLEKDQITYIPVNNFRSVPKELSAFDVAACFESDQKIPFEIKVEGPVQLKETKPYANLFETVQTKLLSIGVSVPRISELQTTTHGDSTTFFTAWLLENPMSLGYGKNNSEPNKENAYKILENLIKNGSFIINITDTNNEVLHYKATSIRILSETKEDDGSKKYSAGSIAGVGIAMLIIGLVVGVVGLVVFLNRREGKEKEKLVSS